MTELQADQAIMFFTFGVMMGTAFIAALTIWLSRKQDERRDNFNYFRDYKRLLQAKRRTTGLSFVEPRKRGPALRKEVWSASFIQNDEWMAILESDLKFRQGTQITCPECNKLVATANRDIYSGEKMESAAWDWIEKLSRMVSPCCGKTYISGGPLDGASIHTKDGWVSRA